MPIRHWSNSLDKRKPSTQNILALQCEIKITSLKQHRSLYFQNSWKWDYKHWSLLIKSWKFKYNVEMGEFTQKKNRSMKLWFNHFKQWRSNFTCAPITILEATSFISAHFQSTKLLELCRPAPLAQEKLLGQHYYNHRFLLVSP